MDIPSIVDSLFRRYKQSKQNDVIYYKDKIKQKLLKSDELLYALNNRELQAAGAANDEYFGENILPYVKLPDIRHNVKHYLLFEVSFNEVLEGNELQKYALITFTAMCAQEDNIDDRTGMCRHDLIAAIVQDAFNWSNLLGMQLKLISNKAATTDSDYATRTLVFQQIAPNGISRNNTIINNRTNI